MTISTGLAGAVDGYLAARPGQIAVGSDAGMCCHRAAQPSRRAVLHLRAAGDRTVSADLVSWFNERAFHFYLADVRLPGQPAARGERHLGGPVVAARPAGQRALTRRPAARRLQSAIADLDAACARLRESDGMDNVIVSAAGTAALVAALWSDARQGAAADALILYGPVLPARRALRLNIDCPVLVLDHPQGGSLRRRSRGSRPVPVHIGNHVTWLRLRCTDGQPCQGADADVHKVLAELGRWLGAYMYGQLRDRLL